MFLLLAMPPATNRTSTTLVNAANSFPFHCLQSATLHCTFLKWKPTLDPQATSQFPLLTMPSSFCNTIESILSTDSPLQALEALEDLTLDAVKLILDVIEVYSRRQHRLATKKGLIAAHCTSGTRNCTFSFSAVAQHVSCLCLTRAQAQPHTNTHKHT